MTRTTSCLLWPLALGASLCVVLLTTQPAAALPVFSIDWDSTQALGGFVDEGDLLVPQGTGQFPSPAVFTPAAAGGLGVTATAAGGIREVDAVSYGLDARITQSTAQSQRWSFSVDQYA